MKNILLFLSLWLLCSCSRGHAPQRSAQTVVRDSVVVTRTLRDTLVRIEADSAMMAALVECDSSGRAYLRELIGYRAGVRLEVPRAQIKDNVLTVTACQKELEQKVRVLEEQLLTATNKVQTVTETVYINELTRWQRIRLAIANVLLAAVALSLVVLLCKRIRRR